MLVGVDQVNCCWSPGVLQRTRTGLPSHPQTPLGPTNIASLILACDADGLDTICATVLVLEMETAWGPGSVTAQLCQTSYHHSFVL